MLVIFLFNVGGYYLALLALEYRADTNLSVRIDREQYEETETITIKIPLTLPYAIQQHGYERVSGDFEYQGEYYKLVKHKLEDDILYVVCIKNEDQKQVEDTITDYVKLTNDLPGNAKKALSFFSKLTKDYQSTETPSPSPHNVATQQFSFFEKPIFIKSLTLGILSPPPKA